MNDTNTFGRLVTALCLFAGLLAAPAHAEKYVYYHLDALGSPVAVTDQQGALLWREDYKPYGDRILNDPAAANNARWYTGHVQDPDTELVYAGARYYDPEIGRFMATDPVAFTEKNVHSFNRYAYGNNSPYRYVDPDGNDSVLVHEYSRWSGPDDLGHSVVRPYQIHGYTIRDMAGANNAGMASLMPPTGKIELTFEARQGGGGRGSILGSEDKVAEIVPTGPGANHAIGIRDVGSPTDTFTEGGPDGRRRSVIRMHAGGPNASVGCITSPTCPYNERRTFESDVTSAVGAVRRNQGGPGGLVRQREQALIQIPAR